MVRPLLLKPQWMNGLSERLLVSHYENNYGGALRRLNAITTRLAALDWARTPVFEINGLKREELIASSGRDNALARLPVRHRVPSSIEAQRRHGSLLTRRWRKPDSNLYGAFPVKWLFSVYCRFFVRSGKAVLHPVACDQVPGARGRGQGTETVAQLGGLPP